MKRRLFQTASLGLAMTAASPLLHAVVLAKDPPGGSPPIDFVPDNSPEPVLQTRNLTGGAVALLPDNYDARKTYPVVVLFPFTGGRASTLYNEAFAFSFRGKQEVPYIVVILPDLVRATDYATGAAWSALIALFDATVQSLGASLREQQLQMSKLILAGYSVGGDLSWALLLRNPSLVGGAIIMASRSTYRGSAKDLKTLADDKAKVAFVCGTADERLGPLRDAANLLQKNQIANRVETVDGADHVSVVSHPSFSETLNRGVQYITKN